MANKAQENKLFYSSSSYAIKKMQAKLSEHFCTPDRMINIKNSNNNKCIVQNVQKLDLSVGMVMQNGTTTQKK